MEFQPWVGGRIIDHGTDGTTRAWTRILAYEPPHRVVCAWDITTTREIETDPAKTSEVEITFDALDTRPHPGRVDPPLPRISDDQIRARLGGSAANTMVVLLPTDTLVRPKVDPII